MDQDWGDWIAHFKDGAPSFVRSQDVVGKRQIFDMLITWNSSPSHLNWSYEQRRGAAGNTQKGISYFKLPANHPYYANPHRDPQLEGLEDMEVHLRTILERLFHVPEDREDTAPPPPPENGWGYRDALLYLKSIVAP